MGGGLGLPPLDRQLGRQVLHLLAQHRLDPRLEQVVRLLGRDGCHRPGARVVHRRTLSQPTQPGRLMEGQVDPPAGRATRSTRWSSTHRQPAPPSTPARSTVAASAPVSRRARLSAAALARASTARALSAARATSASRSRSCTPDR